MIRKLRNMIPFLLITAAGYIGIPYLVGAKWGWILIILFVGHPLIALTMSTIYGLYNGFNLLYPIFSSLLFLPSLALHYNHTAWIYIIVLLIVSLAGNFIGSIFCRRADANPILTTAVSAGEEDQADDWTEPPSDNSPADDPPEGIGD